MQTPQQSITAEAWLTIKVAVDWLDSHTISIAVAAVFGAAIVALLYGLKLFGRYLCREKVGSTHWPRIIGQTLRKTYLWFMIAVAAQIVTAFAHAPDEIASPIRIIFVIASGLQAAIWGRALILGLVEYRAGDADVNGNLQSAVGLIRVLVTAGLFLLATILILSNLGVNVTGLLAGLGIGGIAIGLAAQGIFSDLFAALSVLFDKPFNKGDMVKFDQTQGTVVAIGLKSTRIQAVSGEEVIISNANLLSKELRNLAHLSTRRHFIMLSLVYQTPPDVCRTLPAMLHDLVEGVADCSFIRCGLETFSPSSIDFQLVFEVHGADPVEAGHIKHDVLVRILALFAEQGLQFAYPTQTTFTAAPDGRMVMPYAEPKASDTRA
jgi:small-conductance mechanosensitive channel